MKIFAETSDPRLKIPALLLGPEAHRLRIRNDVDADPSQRLLVVVAALLQQVERLLVVAQLGPHRNRRLHQAGRLLQEFFNCFVVEAVGVPQQLVFVLVRQSVVVVAQAVGDDRLIVATDHNSLKKIKIAGYGCGFFLYFYLMHIMCGI